jgi:hypothetical protein
MVFLSPLVWWFALAIIVPILVHLFNFRRPKRILFSNVTFVKEVNKTVLRRVKLKQWLLLLTRILTILALVAAFANPIIKHAGSNVNAGAKSVVVVVDNSYSMSGTDGRGNYLSQAKLLAKEIIENHSLSDEFQVMTTGNLRLNSVFTSRAQALERIKEIDYRDKTIGYGKLLSNLNDYFSEARNSNSTFYFLSDFQTATVLNDSLKNAELPKGIEVNFIPIGNQKQVNVYVSDLSFNQAIVEKNKPLTMNLRLNNDSDKEIENLSIKVHVENKVVAIASVSLQANESKTTEVTFTPTQGGWQNGYVSIDDTPIDFDNARYFSYYIPENTRLLVVYGNSPAQYLDLVFRNLVTQYKVETISQTELSKVSLSDYSTVILAGVTDVSSGASDRLKSWINDGGGIMFFPADKMDVGSINNFYQNLGIGRFGGITNYAGTVTFSTPDLSHPIFETVFQKSKPNAEFDSPALSRIYDFQPLAGGIQNTIIKDQNNKIVLQEAKVGSGTVLTFGLYPSLEWSDFPLKSSFVPIIYRGILLLNNAARSDFFQTIGQFLPKKIKTSSKDLVKLRKANGKGELIPEQFNQSGSMTLKFDRTDITAGNYGIYQGDSLLEKISFNFPDNESKLNAANKDRLEEFLEQKGLSSVKVTEGTPEKLRSDVTGNVGGIPLWKYFILAAVLFIVCEVAILKLIKS